MLLLVIMPCTCFVVVRQSKHTYLIMLGCEHNYAIVTAFSLFQPLDYIVKTLGAETSQQIPLFSLLMLDKYEILTEKTSCSIGNLLFQKAITIVTLLQLVPFGASWHFAHKPLICWAWQDWWMEVVEKGGVGGGQKQAGPAQTSALGLRGCIDVRVRLEL